MPVRIYDIAKNLGITSKDVLAKAKELNITNARVASSSIDKITAEYLEDTIAKELKPDEAEPTVEKTPAKEVAPTGPVIIVATKETAEEEAKATDSEEPESDETPEDQAEAKPEKPSEPQVGQHVGFIDLGNQPVRREPRGRRDKKETKKPAAGKAAADAAKPAKHKYVAKADAQVITLKPPIMVRELAAELNRKPFQLIADLMQLGVFANVNQAIDEPTAKQLCAKHGFKFEAKKRQRDADAPPPVQEKKLELDIEDDEKDLKPRPPVVTVMGHVDHGKTTLLDSIRNANVVTGEAGGITQHIGAYSIAVPHPENKKRLEPITFLDTPGHAAFSAMRARGANVTDLIVLVVAADDGIMPQTIECVNHAKASGASIIVAVNKCDLPAANPRRVREQMAEHGLAPDSADWGGDTLFVDVAAVKGEGIKKLLDAILLQAEFLELKANPDRRAVGNVVESGMEQGGPTATVLIRKGTLKVGDIVICGQFYGKTRALIDEDGKRMKQAEPSYALKLLGLNGVPEAGDEFNVVDNEKAARDLAEERGVTAHKEKLEGRIAGVTLENIFDSIDAVSAKILKVIIKTDTQGSCEAIVESLRKIESDKVSLDVIHSAVGTVSESDVNLAASSQAVILGFHTRIDKGAPDIAKHHGVQIKQYKIIYELVDEVKAAMAGLLDPEEKQVVIGTAEVRQIFPLSKGGVVAGCMVTDGRINRSKVRVMRGDKELHAGKVGTLRRFKDNVDVVRSGMECGIRVDGFDDYQEGDVIETVTVEKIAATL